MTNIYKQSKKGTKARENLTKIPRGGIYLGKVTSTKDISRTGRIEVFIAELAKDPTSTDGYYSCVWTSPFAGSTSPAEIGRDIENYDQTIKSYGMWMVSPDVDNQVLVAFGAGNPKFGYVISCLFPDRLTHMVPGMPSGTSYSDPDLLMPVAEKNRFDEKTTHNDAIRPTHPHIAEGIVKQGLINDPLRGAGFSGSRRESPSEVFGILTPGPRDPNNPYNRLGGHQFVMDDNPNSRLIRLRTAGGNQLLMDDTTGVIYMINKRGTAWFEMGTNGDIHVYSEGSINMRSKGNFNLRADKNVNIEAGQDLHLKAAGDNIGDQYVGIPALGALGIPPLGNGGNLRLEAGADLTQYAGLNAQLTASGGDIDLSAGSRVAATASGPLGVDLLAATGPIKMQSALNTSVLSGAGFSVASSAPASILAPLVLLNSAGGVPPVPALPAVPAPQIGTQKRKDAAKNAPEFDLEAAISGTGAAAPTAGERTGRQDKINTIVTSMPTAEPYVGHAQFDPLSANADRTEFDQSAETDSLPGASEPNSLKPADVNTPQGTQQGVNYVNSDTGSVIDSVSGVTNQVQGAASQVTDAAGQVTGAAGQVAGQISGALDALPNYQNMLGAINNFKEAAKQKLLEITGLGNLVAGIKAAIPPIRFPTSNAIAQKAIGVAKQLGELEAQLQQFAADIQGFALDLASPAIQQMRGAIDTAMEAADSFEDLQSNLAEQGIQVIRDGVVDQAGEVIDNTLGDSTGNNTDTDGGT